MTNIPKSPKNSKGFTLLEAMIALVIFSIGLLGLAGLQATSIKFNKSAYLRTQATFLAYDMLDRMRANIDKANDTSANYLTSLGTVTSPSDDCMNSDSDCDAGELFLADRSEWKAALTSTLPSGDGTVTYDTSNGRTEVIITVYWDDERDGTADDTFAIRAEL